MNHSSDKWQPALIHALTPVNPFHPPQKASSPACARPPRPRARPSPAARLPSCAQDLFCPNSRELSSISRKCAPACQPLHPPPKALQRGPYPPAATTRAAFASHPSAVMRPKFLAQSHTFSRKLSCNAHPSRLPVNPFKRCLKALLTSIPFETGTLPANATTVSWPSRLPLRNTKYEIRNSAPNLLLPPCKSLHHRISCTHRRKSKATANHLCTFTNVCRLTEQPQLQDHNAAAPDATRCPHRKIFSERARQHMNSRGNSRHFAPI